jgi:riboflavin kinase / FMN adenylyltransferase
VSYSERRPAAVTIGTFDGVHLGHRALLRATVEISRHQGLTPVALTWDRHPALTLRPEAAPPLLTTTDRRLELLQEDEAIEVAVLPFDHTLARLAPEDFATRILSRQLNARAVLVGEGWRFGHRARGDVSALTELGRRLGFEVHPQPLLNARGGPVSSTRVRAALASGDMEEAGALLGRRWDFDGTVIHGDKRGAGLGYPTANLLLDPALVRPARGIYAGVAHRGADTHPAAVSIGVNPQFGGDPARSPLRIEAYLLDFSGELYGEVLRVELQARLREERTFESVEQLVEQMDLDVKATRALTC